MRNAYLNFKLHQSLWLERRTLIPTCLTFILQFSSIFLVGVNESGARRQVFFVINVKRCALLIRESRQN